jgi:hypothetical protein
MNDNPTLVEMWKRRDEVLATERVDERTGIGIFTTSRKTRPDMCACLWFASSDSNNARIDQTAKHRSLFRKPTVINCQDAMSLNVELLLSSKGLVPMAYSGRMMLGQHCVAVALDRVEDIAVLGPELRDDLHVDNLALPIVAYWPNVRLCSTHPLMGELQD